MCACGYAHTMESISLCVGVCVCDLSTLVQRNLMIQHIYSQLGQSVGLFSIVLSVLCTSSASCVWCQRTRAVPQNLFVYVSCPSVYVCVTLQKEISVWLIQQTSLIQCFLSGLTGNSVRKWDRSTNKMSP